MKIKIRLDGYTIVDEIDTYAFPFLEILYWIKMILVLLFNRNTL